MWYVITYPKLYVYARISSYLTKSFQKITEKLRKMEWYHQYFKELLKRMWNVHNYGNTELINLFPDHANHIPKTHNEHLTVKFLF